MKEHEYEKMRRAENRFWWFTGKGAFVQRQAGKWLEPEGQYLDLGCGTGANLARLKGKGEWTGIDLEPAAVRFCAEDPSARLAVASADRLPFADESFDGATALDILEHLSDDEPAAGELFRVLRPKARLLVTVPAHPWLWGSHDLALGHFRRYHVNVLKRLLTGAGFEVLYTSHFMASVFPAMAAGKLWQRFWGDSSDTVSYEWPGPLNGFLSRLLSAEASLTENLRVPFGTTLFAAAEKPSAR